MIEKDMLVSELLETYEAAGPLLAQAGMACIGWGPAPRGTPGQAAQKHGPDPRLPGRQLNPHFFHRV